MSPLAPSLLACALAAAAQVAAQQPAIHVSTSPDNRQYRWGEHAMAFASAFGVEGCTGSSLVNSLTVRARLTFLIDGIEYKAALSGSCTTTYVGASRSIGNLGFGIHSISARHVANGTALVSEPVQVSTLPAFGEFTPAGWIGMGVNRTELLSDAQCTFRSASLQALGAVGMPDAPPPGITLPHGLVAYEFAKCERPGPMRMLLDVHPALPPNPGVWAFAPSAQDPVPRWRELQASREGRYLLFDVPDAQLLRGVVAVGSSEKASPTSHQGLWWGGADENGWGVSITQHGETYFVALFIYDAAGQPRWMVMPGGRWNAARTAYEGSLYRPRGSHWKAYDPAAFSPGSPVGSLRLAFFGPEQIRIDYTVDGVSGSKFLEPQRFGAAKPMPAPRFDDLWWTPAQNGWGLALAQQQHNLFGIWFTYDEAGETTWYVMPEAELNFDRITSGPLYRTRGSPWLGARYDANALSATLVGELILRFEDRAQAFFQVELPEGSPPRVFTRVEPQPF